MTPRPAQRRYHSLPLLALLILLPQWAWGQVVLSDRSANGSLVAAWNGTGTAPANSAVLVSLPSQNGIAVQLTGTFSGTVQFEALIDQARASWLSINGTPFAGGSSVSSATATGAWIFNVAGVKVFRVRCSTYTSGTIQVGIVSAAAVPPATATISGTVTTAGAKTNNAAAPGATNVGTLPGIANAAAPTWTEGNQVGLSVDLSGNLRSVVSGLPTAAAAADTTANPTISGIGSFPYTYNGTTWDRWRDVNAANAGGFSGIGAVGSMYLDTGTGTMRRGVTAASTTSSVTGIQVPATGVLGYDGLVFRPLAIDSSGRTQVVGAAAAGAPVAGNPVQVGLADASGNAQNLKQGAASSATQGSTGFAGVVPMMEHAAGDFRSFTTGAFTADAGSMSGNLAVQQYVYNGNSTGVGADRIRNNINAAIRADGTAVTVQTVNTDITNYNGSFFQYHAHVGNYNGGTLTVKLQWKDANGLFVDIPAATTTGLTTGADIILQIGPTVWPANTSTMFNVNWCAPRLIRVVETIATATITFGAAYDLHAN